MTDLSIIVVNWNTRELLRQCLRSVVAATSGIAYEIIVVDNGSADGSVQLVRDEFPQARCIANRENRGFARANNQGIAASSGRHLLLLNSDTIVRPGALVKLVHFVEAHPGVGIAGPELRNGDGTLQLSWARFPTLASELRGVNVRRRQPFPSAADPQAYRVDWIGGACLLIRRATVEQIGLLDERFFMYSEETDWCFRARQQGWDVCLVPAAQVIHLGGQSSRKASARMKAELYGSKAHFFAKHYSRGHARLFALLLRGCFLARASLGWLLYRASLKRWQRAAALEQESWEVLRTLTRRLRHAAV